MYTRYGCQVRRPFVVSLHENIRAPVITLARALPPVPNPRNRGHPCDSVAVVLGRRGRWCDGWHENCRR
jgi:hypothetical protein